MAKRAQKNKKQPEQPVEEQKEDVPPKTRAKKKEVCCIDKKQINDVLKLRYKENKAYKIIASNMSISSYKVRKIVSKYGDEYMKHNGLSYTMPSIEELKETWEIPETK